jgi:glycosyltransferase involved in cell wall biosynthesis
VSSVDVSVLICTFNRASFLEDALNRLVSQETNGEFSYEIVVVDNASTDGTADVVKRFMGRTNVAVSCVYEPSEGIHQARNRSLMEARGTWLAFIDDDEIAEPTWLKTLFDAANETGACVLGGTVRVDLPPDQLRQLGIECRRSLSDKDMGPSSPPLTPCDRYTLPGTGNMMVHREVIENVGNFDETMTLGGEDHDLLMRAKRAGFTPWYVRDAVVYHRIPEGRLNTHHIKADALRSGVTLAILRQRYDGSISMLFEAVARVGQVILYTIPSAFLAFLVRDTPSLVDRRIKYWRMMGFVCQTLRHVLPESMFPCTFLKHIDFRENRPRVAPAVGGNGQDDSVECRTGSGRM